MYIKGAYNKAFITVDDADFATIQQVKSLYLNLPSSTGSM